jgi:SNW domain-containing protein 1
MFLLPYVLHLLGRGLQEVTINNKFATLSESLYIAERKASEELRIRNQIRKKMSMKEKEDKEAELREMANRVRIFVLLILSYYFYLQLM